MLDSRFLGMPVTPPIMLACHPVTFLKGSEI